MSSESETSEIPELFLPITQQQALDRVRYLTQELNEYWGLLSGVELSDTYKRQLNQDRETLEKMYEVWMS